MKENMQVNLELEKKLWSITRPNLLNKNEFKEIIDYLFDRLNSFLQQTLEVIGEDFIDDDSFCRSFKGFITPTDVFKITFVGVIGVETIGDDFKPHTSANLYLFGNHERLTAGQPNVSYIYLEYIKNTNEIGNWVSQGWMLDEYEEYQDIVENEFI